MSRPSSTQTPEGFRITAADAVLLRYLAEREANCPRCAYNVHALTVPRCPECGARLCLRIVPRHGGGEAWAAILTAGAALYGPGVPLLLVCLFLGLKGWRLPATLMTVAGLLITLICVLARRRIICQPTRAQHRRIVLAWLIVVVVWAIGLWLVPL